MTDKKIQKITENEMKSAVLSSGYLLEQRVESVLQKKGFYVTANDAYLDPVTGKSREIDINAIYGVSLSRDYDFIFTKLLCECVNNPQPLVFFVKESPISFMYHEEVKVAGIPVQFIRKDKKTGKEYFESFSDFLKLEKYHHYCKGPFSTQYCSFDQKKNTDVWMAYHVDVQHDSLTGLIYALESEINEYCDSYSLPAKKEEEKINIEIYYPLLILQGPLYIAQLKKNSLALKKVQHAQYRKAYCVEGQRKIYQIDVITESFLPRYLRIIDKEIGKIESTLKRSKNKIIARESIKALVAQARKKNSKQKYRDIFEL